MNKKMSTNYSVDTQNYIKQQDAIIQNLQKTTNSTQGNSGSGFLGTFFGILIFTVVIIVVIFIVKVVYIITHPVADAGSLLKYSLKL